MFVIDRREREKYELLFTYYNYISLQKSTYSSNPTSVFAKKQFIIKQIMLFSSNNSHSLLHDLANTYESILQLKFDLEYDF